MQGEAPHTQGKNSRGFGEFLASPSWKEFPPLHSHWEPGLPYLRALSSWRDSQLRLHNLLGVSANSCWLLRLSQIAHLELAPSGPQSEWDVNAPMARRELQAHAPTHVLSATATPQTFTNKTTLSLRYKQTGHIQIYKLTLKCISPKLLRFRHTRTHECMYG